MTLHVTFIVTAPNNLPFLVLGNTPDVQLMMLPRSDDANSAPIYITEGMPLGSTTQTIAYVCVFLTWFHVGEIDCFNVHM